MFAELFLPRLNLKIKNWSKISCHCPFQELVQEPGPNMYVCKLKITFSHLFEKVMPKCTARKTKRAFYNISNLKLHSIAMFG